MFLFMTQINEIDTDTLMFEDDDVTLSEVPEEDIDAANLHILHELEEVWMWQFLFTEHNRCFHLFIHLLQKLKEIGRNFSSLRIAVKNKFSVRNFKSATSVYFRKRGKMIHQDIDKDVDCFIGFAQPFECEEKNEHINLNKSRSYLY